MKTSQFPTKHYLLVSLALVGLVGCGGPYDASVTGVVKLDGSPLSRGTVTFNPTSQGAQAYGRINGDGSYVIHTGREEGISSGDYRVTIVSREAPSAEGRDGGPPPMGKSITPTWYRNPNTSGLEYTVESGSQEINLDLSTEPPPGWQESQRPKRR